MDQPIKPAEVAAFWREAGPKAWFAHDAAFDQTVRERLGPAHLVASRGELGAWADGPEGALALLILLDQAPRNIYRGSAHAFASDPLARATARLALAHRWDQGVEPLMRPFFYLPFDHSESKEDQDFSVALSEAHRDATGDEGTLHWAIVHRDIIIRFGRFPHRNACLGRATTPEEQAFLDEGGFAG